MYSSEASCSDCKIEKVEKRWTLLLLKWLNRCVGSATAVRKLNYKSLADVMNKYSKDICANEIERAVLSTDNVESFIKYKYPILRLRNLCEGSDIPRRLYIATTIILYHCCMNAREGAVDEDICRELTEYEQEKILKFCENLSDMEVTVNNVEKAITDAFESKEIPGVYQTPVASTSGDAAFASDCAMKGSSTSQAHLKQPLLKFNSSVTVLPSVVAETDTYSELDTESDIKMIEKDNNVGSAEINSAFYPKPTEIGFVKSPQIKCDDVDVKRFAMSRHKVYGDPSRSIHRQQAAGESERVQDREREPDNDNCKYYKRDESDEFRYEKHRVAKGMADNMHDDTRYEGNRYEDSRYEDIKEPNERILTPRILPVKGKNCLEGCSCPQCTASEPCCGDPSSTLGFCEDKPNISHVVLGYTQKYFLRCNPNGGWQLTWKAYILAIAVMFLIMILVGVGVAMPVVSETADPSLAARIVEKREMPRYKYAEKNPDENEGHSWECVKNLCQKVYDSRPSPFSSFARCSLVCMGPQIWPLPIGFTKYSNKIVALSTSRLEYKFQSLPCDAVHQFVAEAFKTFLGHLVRLEKQSKNSENSVLDLPLMKLYIQIFVETDTEPRIRLNTDESYNVAIETIQNQLVVKVSATSFCGVRHGLETLSQLILLDQTTGKLITLSDATIKDAPSHKYRGLMIDTGRNYIPMQDLIRTIDAMATVKLNTFHWRISDVTSFPLLLPDLPELFEFGAYDRSMVYTKEDVTSLANRAHYRGIRVLIEVAAPGPVGRPWSWSPDVSCHKSKENFTCSNILCLRLNMKDSVFDTLERIYMNIIEMTRVNDVFHLSDGIFSLMNCLYLVDDREGFLEKALFRLKQANKGFLPELPIVWYTQHLKKAFEARAWEKLGVQINDLESTSQSYLEKFKAIYSAKWDLSCLMEKQRCKRYRTWQEMYSWTSWRNIEVFTIQGGEAVLWTDLVTSSNLDSHIWPRAAAVAERLWSDIAINTSVSSEVYVRLDHHSVPESIALILRTCLGGGLLNVHVAVQRCGAWTAMSLNCVLGFIITYCMYILARSAQNLYGRTQIPSMTYPDLAEAAVFIGPWQCLRKYRTPFRYIIVVMEVFSLFGCCYIYQVLMARIIKQLVDESVDIDDSIQPTLRTYAVALVVPIMCVCMIVTSLSYLAPFSMVADTVFILITISTAYYGIKTANRSILDMTAFKTRDGLVQYIGTFIFSAEGIATTLAIEGNMTNPKKIGFVISTGMFIVILMNAIVGFFGFWGFTEDCTYPITVNFPWTPFPIMLKVFTVVTLLVTYALNYWLPFNIVWYNIKPRIQIDRCKFWEKVFRALFVIIITAVAGLLPNIHDSITAIGCSFFIWLGIIFPAFIDLLVVWEDPGLGKLNWRLVTDASMIIGGLIVSIFGTTISTIGFVQYFYYGRVE